ncbi:uncharacterized protein LOC100373425 [Saccoglossus kowalevskii]|uniref:Uncharacterized protein LOC100373425 n=1 Tax=Saccoglossus kowalevskii TaxID=10224 RepID=A0ABM0GTY9_SACKO|nr:PREDICTED: uncharacterized protein LOC100373425 [Saccoglossus kowalevskii]
MEADKKMLTVTILLIGALISTVTSVVVTVNQEQSAQPGDGSVALYCALSDIPDGAITTTVEWQKSREDGSKMFLARSVNPGQMTSIDPRYAIVNEGSLSISDVNVNDTGTYWCQGRVTVTMSDAQEDTKSTMLHVAGPTTPEAPPKTTKAAEKTDSPDTDGATTRQYRISLISFCFVLISFLY